MKTLKEQLKDWGNKLQEQYPECTILTNDPENPGYIDGLLQFQDPYHPDIPECNILNWDYIQILDIHLDIPTTYPNPSYSSCWSFAFYIPNPKHDPDLILDCLYALKDLLDDDSIAMDHRILLDSGYIMIQIEC